MIELRDYQKAIIVSAAGGVVNQAIQMILCD